MKKSIFLAALVASAPLCTAGANPFSIFAVDPMPATVNGSAYISLGGGFVVQQVPTFSPSLSAFGTTTPVFSSDASIPGGVGGLTIGTRLNWLGVGRNPRIEFSLGGQSGHARKTGGQGILGNTVVSTIDGSQAFSCGTCDTTTVFNFRHTEIGGVVRLKTDFRFARRWTATPSAGLVAGASWTSYRSFTTLQFSATQDAPNSIEETVRTFRLGGELGLNVGFRATRRLQINAGVGVSLFSMDVNLKGNDCQSINQPAGGNCSGTAFSTSVDTGDRRFGARVHMVLAATYDAGWVNISVLGFGSWDSALPGVVNPTNAGLIPTAGAARIVYESRWAYGGGVMLTIPLW